MTMYKDYDADKIAAKLKQVLEFEAKYGENDTSRGWKKWCNDITIASVSGSGDKISLNGIRIIIRIKSDNIIKTKYD